MEKYVVSLELCKQLRDAGYENLKGFYWVKNRYAKIGEWYVAERIFEGTPSPDYFDEYVPAPLADEILEQLPSFFYSEDKIVNLTITHEVGGWNIAYVTRDDAFLYMEFMQDSLADACAKIWLYLKKEGLL